MKAVPPVKTARAKKILPAVWAIVAAAGSVPSARAAFEIPAPCFAPAAEFAATDAQAYRPCAALFSFEPGEPSDLAAATGQEFSGSGYVAIPQLKPLVFPGAAPSVGPTALPSAASSPVPSPALAGSPSASPPAIVSLGATDVTLAQRIHRRVEQKISLFYGLGIALDEETGQVAGAGEAGIYSVESQKKLGSIKNFCDPADPALGPGLGRDFLPQAEISVNRRGQPCGQSADVWVETTGVPHVVFDGLAAGSLERSYLTGALVQAYTCYYAKTMRKLTDDAQAGRKPALAVGAGCRARAKRFFADPENPAACDLASELPADRCYELHARELRVAACPRGESAQLAFDPTFSDPGQRKIGCHHARSVRSALESGFAAVAACDIEKRAERAYRSVLGTRALQDDFLREIGRQVYPLCAAQCTTLLGYDPFAYSSLRLEAIDPISVAQCATDCWNRLAIPRIAARIQELWPSTGACQEVP
jgi:hypothetical protein